MNIKEAKEEIKRTLKAYTGLGQPVSHPIPLSKQRPILLIGPPGIGKTAIMEQIAAECQAGLVSYTMTHHTRQSAIGLPYLKEEEFNGISYQITEYTMSEIVASVYQCIRTTGCRYGILFIDEINCISETLVPVMLQFLQNKTFGTHRVPEGWMIVAAGNPPEYNRSVREFDMVTLDRVKKMEIEADYPAWRQYAINSGMHPSILSYLKIHPEHFYSSVLDREDHPFVTARGWEDLSCVLYAYEEMQEPVSVQLTLQYLQHKEIARSFASYYQMFQTYFSQYDLASLLTADQLPEENPLAAASTDELLFITSMMYELLCTSYRRWCEACDIQKRLAQLTKNLQKQLATKDNLSANDTKQNVHKDQLLLSGSRRIITDYLKQQKEAWKIRRDAHLMTPDESSLEERSLAQLEDWCQQTWKNHITDVPSVCKYLEDALASLTDSMDSLGKSAQKQTEHAFSLLSSEGIPDICPLHLAADLSKNKNALRFLLQYPCPAFQSYCSGLLFSSEEKQLRDELSALPN